ncbi:hypothetical protein QJS66_06045 [Kocuria rhizophila]|nr:hypothetical protein QJS66_06045 [Kocuria rhizophila]
MAETYGTTEVLRAPPPPLRGQQRVPRCRPRPGCGSAPRRKGPSWSSWSCPARSTRTTWPPRRTPSVASHAPTRSSTVWSGPPWSGAACRRTPDPQLFLHGPHDAPPVVGARRHPGARPWRTRSGRTDPARLLGDHHGPAHPAASDGPPTTERRHHGLHRHHL